MNDAILVFNAGSSSIKFALFTYAAAMSEQCRLHSGAVDDIGAQARLIINSAAGRGTNDNTIERSVVAGNHTQALQIILHWLEKEVATLRIVAAGHRVVHGGTAFFQAVRVDQAVLNQLQSFIALAPLHQPHALHAISALMVQHPHLPQVACFDTAFHASMPLREQQFALPRSLTQQGVRRYGFHGLSYEYIASVLPEYLGDAANGRVVIAHLGHGVSMCALDNRQSVATTMSFTPLDGLPMGTRSGAIDPAIVLYLLERGMTGREISDLLHHQSGLLGLSGISGDMRTLLCSDNPAAAEAVEFFCYHISRELGSLAVALAGLDAIIFTGGIGEHAAPVRASICQAMAWLGVEINAQVNNAQANIAQENQENAIQISAATSKIAVWVIPTNEELMIAQHTATTVFAV